MNRVPAHTGAKYPIVQAPMGWIARSQLASAVCEAGGLGIIETSSGELDAVKVDMTPALRAEIAALSRTPPPATDRSEETRAAKA